MKMNILLVDSNECELGGHNEIYQATLATIKGTEIYNKRKNFISILKYPLRGYLERSQYLKSIQDYNTVHLLHFDVFYYLPSIIRQLKKNNGRIVATLHWYPTSKIKKQLLKWSSKYVDVIVVHSQYIENLLRQNGVFNVVSIDYPAFIRGNLDDYRLENNKEKIIISCLGKTRYDKGVDILLNSFKYLDKYTKEKIMFVIAGQEGAIKYQDIVEEANKYNINCMTYNNLLSDEEYWKAIVNSDIILLPYRKIFSGNSGPMTDGIYANKYIICSNHGNLGYLVQNYNLGRTFESENSENLGEILNEITNIDLVVDPTYSKELDVQNFVNKYYNLYWS